MSDASLEHGVLEVESQEGTADIHDAATGATMTAREEVNACNGWLAK